MVQSAVRVLKNTTILSASVLLERLVNVVLQWYFIWTLDETLWGSYSTAQAVILFGATIGPWGLNLLLPREIAREAAKSEEKEPTRPSRLRLNRPDMPDRPLCRPANARRYPTDRPLRCDRDRLDYGGCPFCPHPIHGNACRCRPLYRAGSVKVYHFRPPAAFDLAGSLLYTGAWHLAGRLNPSL